MVATDQTEDELFISYARSDNRPIPDGHPHGWVTALKNFIVADHRQYSAAPLRVFFDTDKIGDRDDWRNGILGALRRSNVLLICLSPNYLASQPCRWEWDEFLTRQVHKLVGSEGHATVYFIDVPGSNEHENVQRLEQIMGSNFTDPRPWFPTGAAAMREEAVQARMAALGQGVWERIDRGSRALGVPGNLRAMTPYFIGRNRELAELHRLAGVGNVSEPGLLAITQLSQLPTADWLRIVATTRLDPRPLATAGQSLGEVLVDALDPDAALRLIEANLPGEHFSSTRAEAAAKEIVRELGGFTLAVQQVAVYLALTPDVSPEDYLSRLREEGLHSIDALVEDSSEGQIEHQQKRLRPVLDSMLAPLSRAARTLLGFAALMPPDRVPWPWLKELTIRTHPEFGGHKPGYPDPWLALRRQVEGLRFITPGGQAQVARIHRLVRAHLAATNTPGEKEAFRTATHDLVSVRYLAYDEERRRLIADVLHGGHPGAAEWYVAPLSEVQARAAELGTVKVRDNYDGSFRVGLVEGLLWEEACMDEFLMQEFSSENPASVMWSLRVDGIPSAEINASRNRLEALVEAHRVESRFAVFRGLFLYNLARYPASFGSWRSAWHYACEAADDFENLAEVMPDDPQIAGLLELARRRKWLYDD
jgi:hypothetical protein